MRDNFRFFIPLDTLEKAKDKNGNEIMKIGGIASTSAEDADGEFLDPKGFDLSYFVNSGFFNYNHQSKTDPNTIIGEPTKADITSDGLYVEGFLYPDNEIAKAVYKQAKTLEKNSSTRRLGFSIEGKALKRKSNNKDHADFKVVEKAAITGCALTFSPKNPKTYVDLLKGFIEDDYVEEYDTETLAIMKSISADSISGTDCTNNTESSGAALKTDKKKKTIDISKEDEEDKNKKQKFLSKSQIYEQILQKQTGINLFEAEKIYHFIIKSHSMNNEIGKIEESDVEKALNLLNKATDLVKAKEAKEDEDKEDKDEKGEEDEDADDKDAMKKSDDDDSDMAKSKNASKKKDSKKKEDEEEDGEEMKMYKAKKKELETMEKSLVEKGILDKTFKEPIEKSSDEDKDDKKPFDKFTKKKSKEDDEDEDDKDMKKSLDSICKLVTDKNHAVGVILKGIYDEVLSLKGRIDSLDGDIKKSLGDSVDALTDLNGQIDILSKSLDEPVGRKSQVTSKAKERNFIGNDDIQKSLDSQNTNIISIKDRNKVLSVLDDATFSKGYDAEYSQALTTFESTGSISQYIAQRLSKEKGVGFTA